MVGTRRTSAYGETQAFRFAQELSEHGVCIVSGLAYGIDKAAHLGALEGEGGTVAVVAQGLRIYNRPVIGNWRKRLLKRRFDFE